MDRVPGPASFEIGTTYRRRDIHAALGGQRQGGISTPRSHPVVIIFAGKEGNAYGYRDEWKDDGFFHYTGEGQIGPMQMTKGNLAILKHAERQKSIMLFEKIGKDRHRFSGYMECAGYYEETLPDLEKNMRRGFVFKLRSVLDSPNVEESVFEFDRATLSVLRQKAIEASSQRVDKTTRLSTYRERSRMVAAYVQSRAHGYCEGCGRPAPFQRGDGTPYLETHHTRRVSDDGPDAPSHVMALCPICHTRVHHSGDGSVYNNTICGVPAKIESAFADDRAKVVAAGLIIDSRGRVFVAERASGALAGFWEFPGGKLRDGESPKDCLRREIREELRIGLDDVQPFLSVDHDYDEFFIRLLCFTCRTIETPVLTEHRAGRWLSPSELKRMALAPADAEVARHLQPFAGSEREALLAADRERASSRDYHS